MRDFKRKKLCDAKVVLIEHTYIHSSILLKQTLQLHTRRTKATTELKGERTVFDRNDLRCAKNLRGEGRSTTTFAQQGKGCEMLPLRV